MKHCINCNAVIYDDKVEICPICKKSVNIFEPEKSLKAAEFNERLKVSSRILAALSYIHIYSNLFGIFLPTFIPIPLILISLLSLIFKKNIKFLLYHIKRGAFFTVVAIVEAITLGSTFSLSSIINRIGFIFYFYPSNAAEISNLASYLIIDCTFVLVDIALFVMAFVNIIYALQGKEKAVLSK